MTYFRVIIPTYNSEKTIERAVLSVKKQTFTDYDLIIVDDCSKNPKYLDKYLEDDAVVVKSNKKSYNGGTRNVGMEYFENDLYTLFLDSDDEFISENFFQELHDFIERNKRPDLIRLSYIKHIDTTGQELDFTSRTSAESDLDKLANSCRVACWTKCIKSNLLVKFPENTLMEDVCQHLLQIENIKTMKNFNTPAIRWHIRPSSTSHNMSDKWKSSAYRFVADLMDLQLRKGYTIRRRNVKLQEALRNLSRGIYEQ